MIAKMSKKIRDYDIEDETHLENSIRGAVFKKRLGVETDYVVNQRHKITISCDAYLILRANVNQDDLDFIKKCNEDFCREARRDYFLFCERFRVNNIYNLDQFYLDFKDKILKIRMRMAAINRQRS